MTLHELKSENQKSKKPRVGRGNGSGRGTYSGRGMNGQKSRSGYKMPASPLISKLPKLRGEGFTCVKRKPILTINLRELEANYKAGELVSAESLLKKNLIKLKNKVKFFQIKILGDGTLSKKLKFDPELIYSKNAKAVIDSIK